MNAVSPAFVDTNILLYSLDPGSPGKQRIARQRLAELWESGSGRLSWQVLHEFYVNATKKFAVPVSAARAAVSVFTAWRPVDTSAGLIERAWHWSDEAGLSHWDALIVAAAERSGASTLLSEDMQDGRHFGEVVVVNPFVVGK